MFKDITGRAIADYYEKNNPAKLWIYNRYGPKEEMPVSTYFRTEPQMPELELMALQQCNGRVLDVGAGAGSHSLLLQQRGFTVTALDISPLSILVAQKRGVINTVCTDIFEYNDSEYDTLLLLMNGIGLAGNLDRLHLFLHHAKSLLKPSGKIILDSSDIAYLYKGKQFPQHRYYGEIQYQYSYKSQKTDWFSWLYLDKDTLSQVAQQEGWAVKLLFEDGYDQYLAQLTRV